MSVVTPETNAARIIAEAVASMMAKPLGEDVPVVEELPPNHAAFSIETPMGAFYVRVSTLADPRENGGAA